MRLGRLAAPLQPSKLCFFCGLPLLEQGDLLLELGLGPQQTLDQPGKLSSALLQGLQARLICIDLAELFGYDLATRLRLRQGRLEEAEIQQDLGQRLARPLLPGQQLEFLLLESSRPQVDGVDLSLQQRTAAPQFSRLKLVVVEFQAQDFKESGSRLPLFSRRQTTSRKAEKRQAEESWESKFCAHRFGLQPLAFAEKNSPQRKARDMERTLILAKPDAVQRGMVGNIISRFEAKGLKIVGLKLMQISDELAERHYAAHAQRHFYQGLVRFMTSAPVVAMAIEGIDAVRICRKMMGATFGSNAEPGTIRGDLAVSNSFNLIHGSDSPEAASGELELFFTPGEILDYELHAFRWIYDAEEELPT